METHITDITRVIQLAVAPVFLITGVGTFINVLNSRLARIIDRRRVLEEIVRRGGPLLSTQEAELPVLARRLRFIYMAILCAVTSALLVCLLVAGAFLGAFMQVDLGEPIAVLFILAMVTLVACLACFLREIFLAVTAGHHAVGWRPAAPAADSSDQRSK
jgi:hypothetical protein